MSGTRPGRVHGHKSSNLYSPWGIFATHFGFFRLGIAHLRSTITNVWWTHRRTNRWMYRQTRDCTLLSVEVGRHLDSGTTFPKSLRVKKSAAAKTEFDLVLYLGAAFVGVQRLHSDSGMDWLSHEPATKARMEREHVCLCFGVKILRKGDGLILWLKKLSFLSLSCIF